MEDTRKQGILMVICGCCLWGLSGCAGQYLLQNCALSAEYLVVTRLILAGLILLAFDYARNRQNLFCVFKSKADALPLVIFAFCGMLAVQYTYFVAIAYSNAAAVTVIQYLMPVFILLYTAFKQRKIPKRREISCVALAFLGTLILVTHCQLNTLSIPAKAFSIALLSAVIAAFYTIYPRRLLMRWRAPLIIGWSMLIGGIGLSGICPPIPLEGVWDLNATLMYVYLVIFGTVIPFVLYLSSTKYIAATETGILASFEPLSSIVCSTWLLDTPFGAWDLLGSGLILLTVMLLTYRH